ncbi:DUF4124 domain-containing protein [Kaarinaea lacus]
MLICLCLLTTAQAGSVYKWVDEEGNIHYSQDPQHRSAQEMDVKTKPASSDSGSDGDAKEDAYEAQTGKKPKDDKDKARREHEEKEQQAMAAKKAEQKQKNCQIAMKRRATIAAGGRLYEVDEKGERHYWSDAEREAKLAEAEQQVADWCSEE